MGRPRWHAPKHYHFLYWGSAVGRRGMFVPFLKEHFGELLHVPEGVFGRDLLALLDRSYASLYVAHSAVRSYSTWRLWQTLATSAAFVGEPGDTWPFEPGKHILTFDQLTSENYLGVLDQIREIGCDVKRLGEIAECAADELGSRFTIDRVVDRYLVPASVEMRVKKDEAR
jgi:hypothetical protein